jgi:hypothetical protein
MARLMNFRASDDLRAAVHERAARDSTTDSGVIVAALRAYLAQPPSTTPPTAGPPQAPAAAPSTAPPRPAPEPGAVQPDSTADPHATHQTRYVKGRYYCDDCRAYSDRKPETR